MKENFKLCIKTKQYVENVRREHFEKPLRFDVYYKEFEFETSSVLNRELFLKILINQFDENINENPEQIIGECTTFDENDNGKILNVCFCYYRFIEKNKSIDKIEPIWFTLTDSKIIEVLKGEHSDWNHDEIQMLTRWCKNYKPEINADSIVKLDPEIIDKAKEGPLRHASNMYIAKTVK